MGKTYNREIWRSIAKSKKRFISILAITALGVTVLTGIYAACQDLYYSADRFFDEQKLFDIRVLSTLGLTQDDLEALKNVSGIELADGAYSETVNTTVNGVQKRAELTALSQNGINMPYLLQGNLPKAPGEIAVPQKYLDATGKSIGDSLDIEEKLDLPEEENSEEQPKKAEGTKEESEDTKDAQDAENTDDTLDTQVDWDAQVDVEEEPESPNFKRTSFVITAAVQDAQDISDNSNAFRATNVADYSFFITQQDIQTDVYTSIYLKITGLAGLNSFSKEYEDMVQQHVDAIETQLKAQREKARYDAVVKEALVIITDAEKLMDEKFGEADSQFADAWAEVEDAKKELIDGEAELSQEEKDAIKKLAEARAKLEDARQKLADGQAELDSGRLKLDEGVAEWNVNAQKLKDARLQFNAAKQQALAQFALAEEKFAQEEAKLADSQAVLEVGIAQLTAAFGASFPTSQWDALQNAAAENTVQQLEVKPESPPNAADVAAATTAQQAQLAAAIATLANPTLTALSPNMVQSAIGMGMVNGGKQVLFAQKAGYETQKAAALEELDANDKTLAQGEAQLEEGRLKLQAGKAELDVGAAELAKGWDEFLDGEKKLNEEEAKALREIAKAWQDIVAGKEELADGEKKLIENQAKYEEKKTEAQKKLADAYAELADIDMAEWYVQSRTSLSSYSSMKSDLSSIEGVGNAFPIVFLIVAILISLTTMTRMVEEERGLIGTYKALGFADGAIYKKYLQYAFFACLFGGIVGDVFGFIFLPKFLIWILQSLYVLPKVYLRFDIWYGLGGILLFMFGIVGSTALACKSELGQSPAALMRPKAPRAGSRVFLEHVPFIWNRLKFLNKVTARNLFRYKKRLFMTILGIAGCTALVVAGFAIKDSVTNLMPKQYDNIYRYGLMAAVNTDDNAKLCEYMQKDENIKDFINIQTGNVKVFAQNGQSENAQLMVVPKGQNIDDYIRTQNTEGSAVTLGEGEIFLTQNAAELLGISKKDSIIIQDQGLNQATVTVGNIVQNYLGNHVYITQNLYESVFGPWQPNAILAHFSPICKDQPAYATALLKDDMLLSAVSIAAVKADFATNFTMMNSVVYVITVLAAGLAFVVLFTLASTNISERVRELATIKVLGFFDGEVHAYVNKETLILTAIGIAVGLPVGRMVGGLLTAVLKMPALYFAVHINPSSYVISALLSFCFALLVNLMTDRSLNRINMVEALKSVE